MSELEKNDAQLFKKLSDFRGSIKDANGVHKTLDDTISRLQKRRWTYEVSGEKKEYRELITKVLSVFNSVKGIGGAVVAADPVIAQPVWTGLCACINVRNPTPLSGIVCPDFAIRFVCR